MSDRPQEAWGGELHTPRWLRRLLRRPEPPGDTPEGAHERRKPAAGPSVLENANRGAGMSGLVDSYSEGREQRRH